MNRDQTADVFEQSDLPNSTQQLEIEEDGSENILENNTTAEKLSAPWWTLIVLAIAVLFMSSAATVLKYMDDITPLLRASWRLQGLTWILIPGAVYQWYKADAALKDRLRSSSWNIVMLVGAGLALGVHFGSWIASLDKTSLPHSLLFVTTSPLIIVFGRWCLHLLSKIPQHFNTSVLPSWLLFFLQKWKEDRPSLAETLGTIIGFVGVVITILDVSQGSDVSNSREHEVTLLGDGLAFLGAFCFVTYVTIGKKLREWLPLFLYVFPVTFVSAYSLLLAAVAIEGSSVFGLGTSDGFGWFSPPYVGWVAYLAVGPGLFGHTAVNNIIKYIDPIIVTVFLLMEPAIGSFIGWLFGVGDIPGIYTWIGGSVVLVATVWVSLAQSDADLSKWLPEPIARFFSPKRYTHLESSP